MANMVKHGSPPPIWTHEFPNRSPLLVIVSIAFLFVTTLFFASRLIWRWTQRMHGLDDVMAGCAYTILLIQTIFGGISAHYGFGKHLDDIRPWAPEALKFFFLYQICYKLLGGFTKLTFCFLYLRIFNTQGYKGLLWVTTIVVAVGSLAFALGTVFQCIPVQRAWDRRIPGHCTSNMGFWFSHAAFNTFMDIVVYMLPIPLIRTLKLARGQRTGLISIFSLGAFVISASIVRMVMLRGSANTTDPTWGSMEALVWTEIEANTSVICCCLPALRVPAITLWRKLRHQHTQDGDSVPDSQKPSNDAWCGPQGHYAYAHHSGSPYRSQSTKGSRGEKKVSDGTRSVASTWYDRVLGTFSHHDPTGSAHSSQENITQLETGTRREPGRGEIYKTTEMHVSLQDLPVAPSPVAAINDPFGERRMSAGK